MKDDNGNPLANILVETGTTHFTYTDANGNYVLAGLINGQKTVTFKKNGSLVGQTTVQLTENKVFDLTVSTLATGMQKKTELNMNWLFPSIVKNELKVHFDEDILQLEILNASGVRETLSDKNIQTVNVSNLKKGIYFVSVNTKYRSIVERFIKE